MKKPKKSVGRYVSTSTGMDGYIVGLCKVSGNPYVLLKDELEARLMTWDQLCD